MVMEAKDGIIDGEVHGVARLDKAQCEELRGGRPLHIMVEGAHGGTVR